MISLYIRTSLLLAILNILIFSALYFKMKRYGFSKKEIKDSNTFNNSIFYFVIPFIPIIRLFSIATALEGLMFLTKKWLSTEMNLAIRSRVRTLSKYNNCSETKKNLIDIMEVLENSKPIEYGVVKRNLLTLSCLITDYEDKTLNISLNEDSRNDEVRIIKESVKLFTETSIKHINTELINSNMDEFIEYNEIIKKH